MGQSSSLRNAHCAVCAGSHAQQAAVEITNPVYDAELARQQGADDRGMRSYVLVATDPVIIKGEMVAEYRKYYGSAGLMAIHGIHKKLGKKGS